MIYTIFTQLDLDIFVYADDGAGNRVNPNTPLLQYCYLQGSTLRSSTLNERQEVWGRPKKRILLGTEEYEMDVDHFLLRRDTEMNLASIFNRTKKLQLEWRFQQGSRIEVHVLKVACAVGLAITSQDNQNVTGAVQFQAEDYSQT